MSERERITEDWLREIGFKWHQFDRQCGKHWLIWLGAAMVCPSGNYFGADTEDFGVELANDSDGDWFCWLRGDTAGLYHRFIHVRHLRFRADLVRLIEGLTGRDFNPADAMYGSLRTPESAARLRNESERLDLQMRAHNTKWYPHEKDESRGRPLPEHVDAAIEGGKAK